jgi:hypothetical protein
MSNSEWIKNGLIFNEHKSQLPVPIIDDNKIRICQKDSNFRAIVRF